jgi:hypothetical protein
MRERRVIAELRARLFVPCSRFLNYKIPLDEVRNLEERLALKA